MDEEAQGRDEQGVRREAALRAEGRSRHQMRQKVAVAGRRARSKWRREHHRASGASSEWAAAAKCGATSPCTMRESRRWTRRRRAEEMGKKPVKRGTGKCTTTWILGRTLS